MSEAFFSDAVAAAFKLLVRVLCPGALAAYQSPSHVDHAA